MRPLETPVQVHNNSTALKVFKKCFHRFRHWDPIVISYQDLAFRELFFRLHNEESRGIFFQTVVRDKGNPKSDSRQVDEQVIAAKLDLRNEVKLIFLEQIVQKFACRALRSSIRIG